MESEFHKKLSSLVEISKAQLSKVLNFCSGPKNLILEPDIIKPLERICGVRWLKGNGVDKIFKLESSLPVTVIATQYFIIYSNLSTFKYVISLIKKQIEEDNAKKNTYNIVVVPKLLYVFEKLLEEDGLFGSVVKLFSFQWLPVHLDSGILSLELQNVYRDLYVRQDFSTLPAVAKCLWQLFFVTGKPKTMLALGQYSAMVIEQLDILCNDLGETEKFDSDFGGLILLDRNVDYPSALLMPATYTALLNEVFGVTCGVCNCKEAAEEKYDNKFNPVTKKTTVRFALDSNQDSVYSDIKNRYFTEVTAILSTLTKNLRTESQNSKEMALDEIKKYIATQLQASTSKKKNLANHLTAAETIVNTLGHRFERQQDVEHNIILNRNKTGNYGYLDELLTIENNKLISLRLMCLIANTQKLSSSEFNDFYTKFLQEFGYTYCYLYDNLINTGFITEESTIPVPLPNIVNKIPKLTSSNFYGNTNKLKQIPSDPAKINLKSPTCCSYVFGGIYIPLISKIASMFLSNTPVNEIKSKLESLGPLVIRSSNNVLQPKCLLLYVVGGVTYAEVAACNLLEVLTGSKIIVCSDRLISGNNLMEALLDSPDH